MKGPLVRLVVFSLLLFVATLATRVRAHDLPMSSIDLQVEPHALIARATAHVIDVAHELGPAAPEDSLVQSEFLQRNAASVFDLVQSRISIESEGRKLRAEPEGIVAYPESQAITVTLRYPIERSAKELVVEGFLFPYDSRHLTLLDIRMDGEITHEDFFNQDQRTVRVRLDQGREIWPVVRRFVESGIHHIFIGPDHILFIVGLMLLGGSVGRLLKIVTGFTIAHSITLTLATLGLLNPPARLIEPLIALSIVFVGLDNLRAHDHRRDPRALLAFGFGFIHGFGFASVLRDFGIPAKSLGWALFSFNVGVEIGQACIVAAVAPLMELLRRRVPVAAKRITIGGSLVVAAAGAWWFIERVFLSS